MRVRVRVRFRVRVRVRVRVRGSAHRAHREVVEPAVEGGPQLGILRG